MRKRDITLILIMIIGAAIVAVLPRMEKIDKEICPYKLIDQATYADKYVSTDEVANAIINNDPSIVLIDIRTPEEFAKFSLRGAINIPLANLLDEENVETFNQDVYTNVLYSNGSSLSSEAWLLLKRMGYKNNHVMQGGLNRWVETIMKPKAPDFMASDEDIATYEFRKGASTFFGGGGAVVSGATSAPAPAKPIIKRKKKEAGGGGCD